MKKPQTKATKHTKQMRQISLRAKNQISHNFNVGLSSSKKFLLFAYWNPFKNDKKWF